MIHVNYISRQGRIGYNHQLSLIKPCLHIGYYQNQHITSGAWWCDDMVLVGVDVIGVGLLFIVGRADPMPPNPKMKMNKGDYPRFITYFFR